MAPTGPGAQQMNGPNGPGLNRAQQMNPVELAQQGPGPNRAQQMNGPDRARALGPNESPRAWMTCVMWLVPIR